jgi:hypothetical protein
LYQKLQDRPTAGHSVLRGWTVKLTNQVFARFVSGDCAAGDCAALQVFVIQTPSCAAGPYAVPAIDPSRVFD